MNESKELLTFYNSNYIVENGVLTWVSPSLKKFVVPNGVTYIMPEIFKNSEIKKLTWPKSKIYWYDK